MNLETLHQLFWCPAPEDIPETIFSQAQYKDVHKYAIAHMGYSVVTQKNCRILASIIGNSPVLEVMCGLGSYSYTLRSLGLTVIATDDYSWFDDDPKFITWKTKPWVSDIERIDAVSAIQKYGSEVGFVIMSWPPMNEDFAAQALETMRTVNVGCRMVYIGEGKGGVTANDRFFDLLKDVSSEYSDIGELRNSYHSWSNNGFSDKQYILK